MKKIGKKIKKKDCIKYGSCLRLLKLKKEVFNKFVEKYKIEHYYFKDKETKYYSKEEMMFFKEQQDQIGKRYIPTHVAFERYGETVSPKDKTFWTNAFHFPPPIFCSTTKIMSKSSFLYDVEDIEAYIEVYKFNKMVQNVVGNNLRETFRLRLEYYKDQIPILNASEYTIKKLINFAEKQLSLKNKKNITEANSRVNLYVRFALMIEEKMREYHIKEIYSLTTNQINMWLICTSKIEYRKQIYYFVKSMSEDVSLKLKVTKNFRKGFDFKKVIRFDDIRFKKKKIKPVEADLKIYDTDTYIELFKYLIDIPYHVDNILKENSVDLNLLSGWLFLLFHLNNGWRKGDILDFPRLQMNDLLEEWKIDDVSWFKNNRLSIEQSRRVITKIIKYDFLVSKTRLYNHFFCSDKLAPAIATAILMLDVYYSYNYNGIPPKYGQPIMMFVGSNKKYPYKTPVKRLLKNFKIEDFSFQSRKMNKTLLTLVYNTSCNINPSGYNELLVPQYMRAHKEKSSTLHYIEFTKEQLEFLSYELFERGEFGFIPNTLLSLITDKNSDDKKSDVKRTIDIALVNNFFGDYQKIESTTGMLNHFTDERKEILELLEQYSLEDCISTINNIFIGNLPSKKDHIQCLYSKEGCKCPDEECEFCKYSIPSLYVLSTLGFKLINEMKSYSKEKSLCKKIKLSSIIHKEIDFLMDAIRKFGKDYVYNCLDISRDDFVDLFNKIEEVDVLIERGDNKCYLTE